MKKDIYKKLIDKYGEEAQKWQFVEEVGEVLQAINKDKKYRNKENEIQEELADLEIMLNQMKIIYGENKINRIKNYKLKEMERETE